MGLYTSSLLLAFISFLFTSTIKLTVFLFKKIKGNKCGILSDDPGCEIIQKQLQQPTHIRCQLYVYYLNPLTSHQTVTQVNQLGDKHALRMILLTDSCLLSTCRQGNYIVSSLSYPLSYCFCFVPYLMTIHAFPLPGL